MAHANYNIILQFISEESVRGIRFKRFPGHIIYILME